MWVGCLSSVENMHVLSETLRPLLMSLCGICLVDARVSPRLTVVRTRVGVYDPFIRLVPSQAQS